MAASFDEWVSVATMKEELRIDAADAWHDDMIERHLKAALNWVATGLHVPLLDEARRLDFSFIRNPAPDFKFVVEIPWLVPADAGVYLVHYIDGAGALQSFNALAVFLSPTSSQSSRLLVTGRQDDEAWPDVTDYWLDYIAGVPLTHPKADTVRAGIVLAARELYNGSRELTKNHVLSTFIATSLREHA